MTITSKTLAEIQAAHVASLKLAQMIDEYSYGHAAPALSLGQFTEAQIDAQSALAASAVANLAPDTTVLAVKITGTATAVVGATSQLTATATQKDVSTANVSSTATWASSNPTKATVSSSGLVTGVAAGTTVITAVKDGVKSAGVTFTVT